VTTVSVTDVSPLNAQPSVEPAVSKSNEPVPVPEQVWVPPQTVMESMKMSPPANVPPPLTPSWTPNRLMPPGKIAEAAGTVNVRGDQVPGVIVPTVVSFQLAQLLDCMYTCSQRPVVPVGINTFTVTVAPGHRFEVAAGGVMEIPLTAVVAAVPASSAATLVRAGIVALRDCVPVTF